MENTEPTATFETLSRSVGRFNLRDKTFLIPEMNRIGSHLLAAVFRGFGVRARVLETFDGIQLGKEYTSGKECYPCQITLGDILHFLQQESERLGSAFDPEDYIYFMPEADGPCRFGMYNKYQRIVLDGMPAFRRLKIGSLTTKDGYSLNGILDGDRVRDLRKAAYFSVVVGDLLDRLLWRIRPYEKDAGSMEALIEKGRERMEGAFETHGPRKAFDRILDELEGIIEEAKSTRDPDIPEKPLIGIVGEIYLRSHTKANQDLIRVLERFGAEVVNASIAEWMNYTSYDRLREAKQRLRMNLKRLRIRELRQDLKDIASYQGDLSYQTLRQKQAYKRVRRLVDLAEDHSVGHLERILKANDLFSFDVGTEACLSIPGILSYAREGFNGVVNVYPFTCMPSTITSAVVKPLVAKLKIPYLDTPYDSTIQPGREAAVRTFMYQAVQHHRRHGRGR